MVQLITLQVRMRPGVRPLAAVVAVLHARAAQIDGLSYVVHDGAACLCITSSMPSEQGRRLAVQLDRRVDVFSTCVTGDR